MLTVEVFAQRQRQRNTMRNRLERAARLNEMHKHFETCEACRTGYEQLMKSYQAGAEHVRSAEIIDFMQRKEKGHVL